MEYRGLVYRIEPMRSADLDEVMAIERLSFPNPWPASAYRYEVEHNQRAHYYVARVQHAVLSPLLGYGGFWQAAEEAHISTIAIHPNHRGRGLGELILASMIDKAIALGAAEVTLEVRVSNHVAQELYRKYGFHPVGLRRGYYTDNQEDALLMSIPEVSQRSYAEQFAERLKTLTERLRDHGESR